MDYSEEIICAIYSRLCHEARMGDDNAFVFYSEIRQMADIEKLEGDYQRKELGHILYLVNEYNWNQNGNRPQLMLSALAINKKLDIGGGFFELARELGRLEKDGDDYVEFEVEAIISPSDDTILNPVLIDSSFDWTPQRSGISIPPDIANRLENACYERITGNQHRPSKLKISSYTEGNKKEAIIYRYERDPNARKACIQYFGAQCQVCGFDFGVQFGEIGQGYIQVHHKTPLSERDGQYTIDPINDLVPVCPNCHAMLHRASPPYTIEELKAILNSLKSQ